MPLQKNGFTQVKAKVFIQRIKEVLCVLNLNPKIPMKIYHENSLLW